MNQSITAEKSESDGLWDVVKRPLKRGSSEVQQGIKIQFSINSGEFIFKFIRGIGFGLRLRKKMMQTVIVRMVPNIHETQQTLNR